MPNKVVKIRPASPGFQRVLSQAARMGKGGDRRLAHVQPGEISIPHVLQTPTVMAALKSAAEARGISLERFKVGTPENRRNPATGLPQFGDDFGDGGGGAFGSDFNDSGSGGSEALGGGGESNSDGGLTGYDGGGYGIDNSGVGVTGGPAPGESTTGITDSTGAVIDNSGAGVTGGPDLSTPGAEPDYGNSLEGNWTGSPLQSTQPPPAVGGGLNIGGRDARDGAIDNGRGGPAFGPNQQPNTSGTGTPASGGRGTPGSGVEELSGDKQSNPISGSGERAGVGAPPATGSTTDSFSPAIGRDDNKGAGAAPSSPALSGDWSTFGNPSWGSGWGTNPGAGATPAAPPGPPPGGDGPTNSTLDFLAGMGGNRDAMAALQAELSGQPPAGGPALSTGGAAPSTTSTPSAPTIDTGGGGGGRGLIGDTGNLSVQNQGGVTGGTQPGESTIGFDVGTPMGIDNSGAGVTGGPGLSTPGATAEAAGARGGAAPAATPGLPQGVSFNNKTGTLMVTDTRGKQVDTGYKVTAADMANKDMMAAFAQQGLNGLFGGFGQTVATPTQGLMTGAMTPSWGPQFQAIVGQIVANGIKGLLGAGLPAGLGTLVGAAGGASKAASKPDAGAGDIGKGALFGAIPGGDLISKLVDTGGDVGKTASSLLTDPFANLSYPYSQGAYNGLLPAGDAAAKPSGGGENVTNDPTMRALLSIAGGTDTGTGGGGGGSGGGGSGGGGSGGGGGGSGGDGGTGGGGGSGGGTGGQPTYYPVYGVDGRIVGWSTKPSKPPALAA